MYCGSGLGLARNAQLLFEQELHLLGQHLLWSYGTTRVLAHHSMKTIRHTFRLITFLFTKMGHRSMLDDLISL